MVPGESGYEVLLMIVNSDALTHLMMMDDESVHCAVTSPPYYGLRDYGVEGQIGLEETPEAYVVRLVEIFRELRRVLRSDGTFWLNIGDSYAGSGKGAWNNKNGGQKEVYIPDSDSPQTMIPKVPLACKPKDLIGIPWMLAFALRADGWYLRSDIPWIKRNSMPSSVTDRPVSSIEHIFLFSKSRTYYYDHIATMQPSSESYNKDKRPRGKIRQTVNANSKYPDEGQFKKQDHTGNETYTGFNARYEDAGTGLRFMRDSDFFFRTWQGLLHNENGEPIAMVVNPRGYKGAHFACFPVQLVEPMILAGTSEKGVCPKCGSPWVRVVETESYITRPTFGSDDQKQKLEPGNAQGLERTGGHVASRTTTTGWKMSCSCEYLPPTPATVLDPFSGSGATGVACQWHGRDYIGIELKPDYCRLQEQRLKENK
jgi:DNA modification methylase